jgi:ribulose-5-phosphate 4-epimerase/fuculose-1-phosphate aldolase
MGEAELALLCGHGVFVIGTSARAIHQRAVALEQRCRHAWHIRAAGGDLLSPVPESYLARQRQNEGNGFIGFWEAMVRQELREDPALLDDLS